MLSSWISRLQFDALARVLGDLSAREIPYVASGGLAANAHGSSWPLHDIDLDVPAVALPTVASLYAQHVRFGPARYEDDEFAIDLLTISLGPVSFDFTASETILLRVQATNVWVPWPTDLQVSERRALNGLSLHVQPLERLVAYKRALGRAADVADLEGLLRRPEHLRGGLPRTD